MLRKCLIKFEPRILDRLGIDVEELTKDIDKLHIAYLKEDGGLIAIDATLTENEHIARYQKEDMRKMFYLAICTGTRKDFEIVMEIPND